MGPKYRNGSIAVPILGKARKQRKVAWIVFSALSALILAGLVLSIGRVVAARNRGSPRYGRSDRDPDGWMEAEDWSISDGRVSAANPLDPAALTPSLYLPLVPNCTGMPNLGFERGSFECWQHGGQLKYSVQHEVRSEGRYAALLGDPDYKCEGGVPLEEAWIKRTVDKSCTYPTLSFEYRMRSSDKLRGDPLFDSFDVYVDDTLILRDGNPAPGDASCTKDPWDSKWLTFTHSLSAYDERAVELSIHNVSRRDHWYNTWAYVDRVQVRCACVWNGLCSGYGGRDYIPVPADYDGDGQADLGIKGPDTRWCIDYAHNGFCQYDLCVKGYGDASRVPVPADYDGDDSSDLGIKAPDGFWCIDYAHNGFGEYDLCVEGHGDASHVPVPADYDGDDEADLSTKGSDGSWCIDYAANGYHGYDECVEGYGDASRIPVPADYDGDGQADLGIKGPDTIWCIDYAYNGFGEYDLCVEEYGDQNRIPVPADYDGYGKADLGIRDPDGIWWIDLAENGFGVYDEWYTECGDASCFPVPADYDGDGRANLSVKCDDGQWLLLY